MEEYDGTIITVSHDRFFLDKLATQILAFEDDGVKIFNGDYTEYHDWRERGFTSIEPSLEPTGKTKPGTVKASVSDDPAEQPVSANGAGIDLSKNQRQKFEKRISEIEKLIPQLEDEAGKLAVEMTLPQTATDFPKLNELSEKHRQLESRIQSLYSEWDEAAKKLT